MSHQRTIENSLAIIARDLGYEKIITDENTTTVTYIGWAEFGTATSAAKWIVQRITSASASSPQGVTTVEWATGLRDKTNIWNSRTSLTYVS